MSEQIVLQNVFKEKVPISVLIDILESMKCEKHYEYFTITKDAYKRGIFYNAFPAFIEACRPYYFESKYWYLDREFTFCKFVTIIRQICKVNGIRCQSKIHYRKSLTNISYNIYVVDAVI